jgi:hypothetical protein
MGIEQKLRESLHRSASALGVPNLRWEELDARPPTPAHSSLRVTVAVVVAFSVAIGSFVILKDAFTNHPAPPADHPPVAKPSSLAVELGLAGYAVVPDTCKDWVAVEGQGMAGYCLDGVVPRGAQAVLIGKELQGITPSQDEINQISRTYGSRPLRGRARIALTNVQVKDVTNGIAHVSYGVRWPDGVFPGVYRCTWTVLDANGNKLGSASDGLASLSPISPHPENVPTSGIPTQATASCDERLDVGTPYSYDFSNVSGSSEATLSYDATWAGTGTPGAVGCTALFLDASGRSVDLYRFNLMSSEGTLHTEPRPALTTTPPAPHGSAVVACSRFMKVMPNGHTYLEGARPSPGADAGTGKGCVQYSPSRPDVHICSNDVPAGYVPDPAPYFNKSVCDIAAQKVNDPVGMSATLASHFPYPVHAKGPVDVATCAIVQVGNRLPLLNVVFVRNEGRNNVHVEYRP